MKDVGEANFVLSIQTLGDGNDKVMALSQASYIDKVLKCYAMIDSKKWNQPSVLRFHLSLEECPKTLEERENMRKVLYCNPLNLT